MDFSFIPKVAWMVINSKCNFRCKWCYARKDGYEGIDMSLRKFQEIVCILKDLEIQDVTLLGGEPTLHPDLKKIVRFLSRNEIKPWLITNGKKLKDLEFTSSLVDSGLKNIAISIKGADEDQYEKSVGTRGHIDALKGFKNLQNCGINPSISITWTRDLASRFQDVIENLSLEGVYHLGMDFGTPFTIGEEVSAENIPNPRECADLMKKIFLYLDKKKNLSFSFYVTFPLCLIEEELRKRLIQEKLISTTCHVPSGSAVIFDQHGKVLPCCHMSGQYLGKVGEEFHDADSFMLFWNNSIMQEFRELCSCYPHENCSVCSQWSVCGGGCLLNWTYWSPQNFIQEERR